MEEGSGWGTHVYLWQIHFDIWQNQYNSVKFKKKRKQKKKEKKDEKKKNYVRESKGKTDQERGLPCTKSNICIYLIGEVASEGQWTVGKLSEMHADLTVKVPSLLQVQLSGVLQDLSYTTRQEAIRKAPDQ